MHPDMPRTIEEARNFAGLRFFEWNEEIAQATQDLLISGKSFDISPIHPMRKRIDELCEKYDDARIIRAIEKIAQKLSCAAENDLPEEDLFFSDEEIKQQNTEWQKDKMLSWQGE